MLHGASHWKATIHIYHPYLPPQKVKIFNLKIDCIHNGLSKNAKSHFGCLGLLGVNFKNSYQIPTKVEAPIWLEISDCAYSETRFTLTKNTRRK
jgi:hypothetical protein